MVSRITLKFHRKKNRRRHGTKQGVRLRPRLLNAFVEMVSVRFPIFPFIKNDLEIRLRQQQSQRWYKLTSTAKQRSSTIIYKVGKTNNNNDVKSVLTLPAFPKGGGGLQGVSSFCTKAGCLHHSQPTQGHGCLCKLDVQQYPIS